MSKSKEELNILKGKYEDVVNEIRELTPEELEQVTGGVDSKWPKWIVSTVEAGD